MTNILKISKIATYLLLTLFLLSSLIYLFFPDLYVSYRTGYSIENIVGYRNGELERGLVCKEFEFFPREVSRVSGEIFLFSLITFILSFISVIVYKILLITKKAQSKNTLRNFLILSVLFLMFLAVFTSDYNYRYTLTCEQFQETCDRLRENPENFGRGSIEEFHARGEFLYCD